MPVPFEQQSNLDIAIAQAFDSAMVDVHTSSVGTILAFYPTTKPPTADVQLGVQKLFIKDDKQIYEPVTKLTGLPVCFPRAGNMIMTWPIAVGDSCIVLFSEREIGQWLLAGHEAPQKPLEIRKHSYSDGIVFPMIATSAETIAGFSTSYVETRTLDGMTKFSVGATDIKMQIGGCEIVFNSQGITVTNGDVAVDGLITLKTHEHTSGDSGSPTSPPIPPVAAEEKNV